MLCFHPVSLFFFILKSRLAAQRGKTNASARQRGHILRGGRRARDRLVKHTEQMAYAMAASPCAVASFGGVANRAAGTSARRPCGKSSTGS